MRTAMLVLTAAVSMVAGMSNAAPAPWVEGKHYFRIQPAQATTVGPGKVEVAEAFSYGCPACNRFLPYVAQLRKSLPPQAQVVYVHASFNTAEQWPLFQRAFYTAQQLGIVDKTHDAMFKAIWGRGELAVVDAGGRIKDPPPTMDDVAQFYARTAGIDAKKFIDTSKSFMVDANVRRAESWMRNCRIDQTPTIVVNGKYRLHVQSAGGINEMMSLVEWLVLQESVPTAAAN